MKKEHLANFHIAGFTYYEGASIFRKLKMGRKLILKLEEENKYDPRAVAIYYKDFKIGFIPRQDNRIFYKLMKVGLSDHIQVRIQQIDATASPEEQIRLVAHLVTN
ncbi:HIRAN domain-containing protein [Psychroserpens ponticola]|uniref:HIRAN domain-containing protein n=1 Tax=Psychroserpens ponticola TaxID=2932268 RepID=A0ABY7RXG3_9FLAO|nr:HIRAN domain-containing protein [Psychroserpens ponticola]WCO01782.1 HIRAN domain-containing protein [Psychroserpens ponticola]